MLEKIIDWVGGLVIHMVKALLAPIYGFMDTIPVLVFGGDKSNLDFLYEKNAVTNVLDTGMPVMFKLVAFCVLVSVVITAAKYSATTLNPNNRTALIEYAKDLMIISICLWHLDFFYNFIFDLNSWIILEFKEALGNFNPDQQIPLLKNGLADNKTITELSMKDHKNDYMFIIFGLFIEAGLMIWANFYYLMRAVTLYVLMLLGPVMVGMWMFPQKKQQTLYWIRELMGAVLIQAIHAITLWLVITLIGGAQNPIIKLILLAMFIPVGEIVKSFIGLSTNASAGIHRAGTMMGMGALASVAGLVKGVRDDYRNSKAKPDDKGDKEKTKEDADNPKDALGANLGTDVGTTSRAARMLKAGQIGSSIGKAATGLAGMAAGAGLGPGAMVAGSQVGSALGSAPGAVAGRSVAAVGEGAVALGKHIGSSVKKGADTYSNLNGESYPELTDEDIAQDLATKDFENWKADNPDSAVASRLKQAFPGASDAEIAKKVAKTNNDQISRFSNQRKQDLQNMKKAATPYGNARDLVNAATNAFQKGYEADHKDTFMSQLPENMSAEEKEKHWNDHLNTKVQGFRNHAEQAATKAGAMPVDAKDKQGNNLFDKSYVNKDAFASRLALGKVGKAVEDVKGETLESGHQNMGQVGALVGASTAAFKKAYSADHKAGFMKQFPADMPQQEKEAAWNKHLDQKVQGFQNHAQQAAESAGIVQQKDGTNYANKEAFAAHLSQQLQKNPGLNAMGVSSVAGIQKAVNGVKTHGLTSGTGSQQAKQVSNVGNLVQASTESFKQGYAAEQQASFMKKLSPTMSQPQKEQAWQSHLNEKGNEFKAVAQQAAVQAGAMPVQAKDTSGKSLHNQSYINKDAFASQLTKGLQSHASLGTVSQQVGSGITSAIQGVRSHGVATGGAINKAVYAATQTQASIARTGDLSVAEIERSYADASTSVANIAQSAGKMSIPTSAVGRMTQQSTKLGMSVMEGAKHLMLADRIDTVSNAYFSAASAVQQSGGNAVQRVISGTTAAVNTSLGGNAAERHYNVTKGLSYAAGVIGGAGAYQATARMVSKHNPYNSAVRTEAKEIQEIQQMVPTTTDHTGTQSVVKGAVRLVTTNNKSWIEAKDASGMTQVVSRYGSGDSSIRSGQVVYQDLNISDGQLTQYRNGAKASPAYIQDSSGGKININRSINVNPNQLVGNQNQRPLQQKPVFNEPPLTVNHKVDNGHFYMSDLDQGGYKNVQMVVERDRSYMVATTTDGTVSRISPFGKGDTRLQANQRIERACEVKDSSIKPKEEILVTHTQDEVVRTETHLNLSEHDPQNLIPFAPNPRLAQRRGRNSQNGKYGVISL
ncbi:type IV secretion system protein (plasmid) [Bacillus cereus]|uniref:type IV secretion system protein n=1 Tax=Bacillus cereus TaxID=1396 RepID=UPI0021CB1211|nr:type IV secretion system protein [Bacillus cereus]MCU7756696.1 type IV secretion system protein [Bacillus cereus]MDC7752752.1 type IV secretion system protein [Bacillus cereus]UXP17186.1 type IV secretion system protein [Bacillus cereus]